MKFFWKVIILLFLYLFAAFVSGIAATDMDVFTAKPEELWEGFRDGLLIMSAPFFFTLGEMHGARKQAL